MKSRGFTIVELLIVIVVIAILAATTVISFNGIQTRARDSTAKSDIVTVHRLIEAYNAVNGHYPITAPSLFIDYSTPTARTDANCVNGSQQEDWVPDLDVELPQSDPAIRGARGATACYMYVSDGTNYVLSAWNVASVPQTVTMYHRYGFREVAQNNQFYLCNHVNIGGSYSGSYVVADDYYRHSYTISNVTGCNEQEPPGA